VYDVVAQSTGRPLAEVLKEHSDWGPELVRRSPRFPLAPPRRAAAAIPPNAPEVKSEPNVSPQSASDDLRLEQEFLYRDAANERTFLVVRRFVDPYGKKTFRQGHLDVDGQFVPRAPEKPWPLYNLPEIVGSTQVIVVEGEKAVESLRKCHTVATTSPAGAGKAGYADWTPLAGKRVILWPDNDESGVAHMREVAAILEGLNPPPAILWVPQDEIDSLGPKGDAADWVEGFPSEVGYDERRQALREMFANCEERGPVHLVERRVEAIQRGEWRAVSLPWWDTTRLSRALLPGTITLLCGDPGATKSFVLLEAAAHWYDCDIPFSLFELEEDKTFWLQRALAQRVGDSNILDDEYLRHFRDQFESCLSENRCWLDGFGKCIAEAPDMNVTLDNCLDWLAEQVRQGKRVLAIDPITIADPGKDPQWVADRRFIAEAKRILRKANCSLVLVTHPRKSGGSGRQSLSDLAGGAAYERFCQTVFWLEFLPQGYKATVVQSSGVRVETHINRALHIRKARNGPGSGFGIGMVFDGKTFRTTEMGLIAG